MESSLRITKNLVALILDLISAGSVSLPLELNVTIVICLKNYGVQPRDTYKRSRSNP
ncbi:MAG: hypothetical protein WED07_00450 [Candidatus Freyarchaeum deiterrae]